MGCSTLDYVWPAPTNHKCATNTHSSCPKISSDDRNLWGDTSCHYTDSSHRYEHVERERESASKKKKILYKNIGGALTHLNYFSTTLLLPVVCFCVGAIFLGIVVAVLRRAVMCVCADVCRVCRARAFLLLSLFRCWLLSVLDSSLWVDLFFIEIL